MLNRKNYAKLDQFVDLTIRRIKGKFSTFWFLGMFLFACISNELWETFFQTSYKSLVNINGAIPASKELYLK